MSLFKKIFSAKADSKYVFENEPEINFGRYTYRDKNPFQLAYMEKSIGLYRAKKYLDAYEHFFLYLKDETSDNVFFNRKNNRIEFEFIQGSKIVKGSVNDQEIYAEAEVVRFEELSSPVMAKLLHENNDLYFNKFVIKNDIYSIKYYSPVADASPRSLYAALKELALKADLFDDVLINEFYTVKEINIKHIKEIPNEEKQVKLKYLRAWLKDALDDAKRLNENLKTKEATYVLLNFLYIVHYLIAPEGRLLDDILKIESEFSQEKEKSGKEKNNFLIEKLVKLNNKPDDELLKSLYKTNATFATTQATNFAQVKQFIESELVQLKTETKQEKNKESVVSCKHILSYSSFAFGMPAVANNLLKLVWQVFYPEYFKELGFKNEFYSSEKNSFNIDLTKAKINHILSEAKKQQPNIEFNTNNLQFTDKLKFATSFFNEFLNLNYR